MPLRFNWMQRSFNFSATNRWDLSENGNFRLHSLYLWCVCVCVQHFHRVFGNCIELKPSYGDIIPWITVIFVFLSIWHFGRRYACFNGDGVFFVPLLLLYPLIVNHFQCPLLRLHWLDSIVKLRICHIIYRAKLVVSKQNLYIVLGEEIFNHHLSAP